MPVPASARGLATGALLLVMVAALAPPARAISVIPDEGATRLDGQRIRAAMVGDVDGDGVRELVRLAPWSINSGYQAAEVISIRDGTVAGHGDALVQRAATPDDTFAGRRPNADNLLPLRTDEAARLIAWRLEGRERVLVASIGAVGLPRPCCLTLWQVTLDGDRTALSFIQDTVSSAASILAADLDADGTDELVVVETPDPGRPRGVVERRILVLRWNGETFSRHYGAADQSAASGPLLWLGNSDGLPGNEVGFLEVPRFDQVAPTLFRIRLDEPGDVVIEHSILPDEGAIVALDRNDGDRLALVSGSGVSLLDWPSGAPKPLATGFSARGGELLGVVGAGSGAAILVARGGALDVLDADLASRQGISVGNSAAPFIGDPGGLQPFSGPLAGGGPNSTSAYLFAGRLITERSDDDRQPPGFVSVMNVSAVAGTAPVGLFGPGLGWTAMALGSDFPIDRTGGLLEVVPGSFANAMWVVPTDQLLAPELDGGLLEPSLSGAVVDQRRRIPTLLTAGEIAATVRAPQGSIVHATMNGAGQVRSTDSMVPAGGELPVQLVSSTTDDAGYAVRLQVVTPAGHAYTAGWEVRVVRGSPRLEVQAPFAPLDFQVRVTGRTDPGGLVSVDGEPAVVAPDGTFTATVGAGLVPRSVAVRAVDLLGNTAETSVSVVAPLDYRQLPWVGITAALTIAVALFLFLRAPRSRQAPRPPNSGTLEEID